MDALLRVVLQGGGRVTAADVAAGSGRPVHEVEPRLRELALRYRCALQVDADGNLTYAFSLPLRGRRGGPGVGDVAYEVFRKGLRGIRAAFKLAMALVLLIYSVTFLVPAAVVAGVVTAIVSLVSVVFSGGDCSGVGDLFDLLDSEWGPYIVLGIIGVVAVYYAARYVVQIVRFILALGSSSELARSDFRVVAGIERLTEAVYRFAMGPSLPPRPGAAATDAALLQRARERGWLLGADVAEATGADLVSAEREATRLLVTHLGEPLAVEGVVAYTFPDLEVTARKPPRKARGARVEASGRTAFEVPECPFVLTGNSGRTDALLCGGLSLMTVSGLLVALLVPVGWLRVVLGWIPLGFAVATALLPGLRWPLLATLNRGVARRNALRAASVAIFRALRVPSGNPIRPDTLVQAALRVPGKEDAPLQADRVPDAVAEMIRRLGGTPDIEGGRPDDLVFPDLRRAQDAERALEKDPPARLKGVGTPIFDSEEGDP